MNNYKNILNYLEKNVRITWLGEIVVPPILLTSEAMQLSLEDVEEIYAELEARNIIVATSEYCYTVGPYFKFSDELKRKIGTISRR